MKIPQTASRILFPLIILTLAPLTWMLILQIWDINPLLLPPPTDVLAAFERIAAELLQATGRTVTAAGCGLCLSVVIGTAVAFLFSQSSSIRAAFYPWAILLQTVPIIALAPIVIVLFERGFLSIVVISTILGLFPVITSTTTGLLQTDRGLHELFQLHSATRWQTLIKLQLPSSLPYLINGIRIAGGTCIVGAIVGEFFVGSSQRGLGALIDQKHGALKTDELYAVVLVSSALGATFFGVVTAAGELFLNRFFGMSLSTQPDSPMTN